jgi:hypothetical protein
MGKRKDGRPRAPLKYGIITSQDFVAGRPYYYTSMKCHKGKHADCPGCPACTCHLDPDLTQGGVVR